MCILLFWFQTDKHFFVECGGLDGIYLSNTLTLERDFNWGGLLVEADPENLAKLRRTHRKSHIFPNCLSTKPEVNDTKKLSNFEKSVKNTESKLPLHR